MPKVYLTDAARREAHAREADQALRLSVATRMMQERITQKEIAKRIGMTPVTLSRRLQSPCMFTIEELRRLAVALEMTEAEVARFV